MSIVPHGQPEARAREDTWQRYERKLPEYEQVQSEDLAYRPATDDFDRSVIPPAGQNPAITLPSIYRGELKNGVRVLGARNTETPTTAISLRIESGRRDQTLDQLGLAALTAGMLNEATESSTVEELSDRLQKLGSSIAFAAGDDRTTATVRSLTRNLDETLAILAEKLKQPKFDPADFARLQAQTLQTIETNKKEASIIADTATRMVLIGADNAIAHPRTGTAATVGALTVEDAQSFYSSRYSPATASIVAVSDLDAETLLAKLAVLEDWTGPAAERSALKPFPATGQTKLYLIDKPGAAQSEIRIGKLALPFDATGEYFRAGLANFVLGGTFNSRINLNLREDKGYTYGARSGFAGLEDYGVFLAQAAVRTDATAASIVEFEQEIRGYAKEGITAAELQFTRDAIGQRDARAYETPRQKLNFLSLILTYDLADDFVDQQNAILAEIPVEELIHCWAV